MDWIAGFFELLSGWIVGNKNKWGFILAIGCNLCWILYVFINRQTYGLLLVVIPAVCINTRNFMRWHKEGKKGNISVCQFSNCPYINKVENEK